ncbi:hypothetical protein MKW98_028682 [Papaver atlanticum]|uniref:Uncharacterized protein n=1 Tax=Papaver atlanticum TaxID=357466 RepID=A0AAD4X710_9MAGN|nr:hypothetical protein MKW98_028682 [Papaver atlanticum]
MFAVTQGQRRTEVLYKPARWRRKGGHQRGTKKGEITMVSCVGVQKQLNEVHEELLEAAYEDSHLILNGFIIGTHATYSEPPSSFYIPPPEKLDRVRSGLYIDDEWRWSVYRGVEFELSSVVVVGKQDWRMGFVERK